MNEFRVLTFLLVAVVFFLTSRSSQAQDSANKIEKEKPIFNWVILLQNPEAGKDLEMIDKQINETKQVITVERNRYFETLRKLSADRKLKNRDELATVAEDMKAQRDAYRRRVMQQIDELLLPHQVERLNQLAAWAAINQVEGYASVLLSDKLARPLEIPKTQTKNIQKESIRLQKEFELELAELREQYRSKLKKELTAKQRTKLKTLLGDKTDFDSTSIRF